MLRVCDNLEMILEEISNAPALFLGEDYIKNIYKYPLDILKTFREFLKYKFNTKEKCCIKDSDGIANKIKLH